MANDLGKKMISESRGFFRRILEAPPAVEISFSIRPDGEGESRERDDGDNESAESQTQAPPIVHPHDDGDDEKAQEAEAVNASADGNEGFASSAVLENHSNDEQAPRDHLEKSCETVKA